MNSPLRYWHVDAFADRPFAGNQAAVMPLPEWPEDAILQAIAEENNFAETAFLVPDASGAATRELRWFTPETEVRLCGHGTLAAGHVLLTSEPRLESATFRTRHAGILEVRRLGEGYELALPAIATAPGVWPEAAALIGGSPHEVWRSPDRYNVFLYRTAAEVIALKPDFAALAELGDHQFIATAPGTDIDIISRVFVPGGGIDEDSVTGSAHAVLAPIWTARLERESFSAAQASRRGGLLSCRIDGDRAWLGGRCVTVVEGVFYL
jgi:predicted PhzF superfamily epimerase YddE/YHI9